MDKKQFERAPFISRQITKLSVPVTDVVQSSYSAFPWSNGHSKVSGIPIDREAELERYQKEMEEIRDFIAAHDDEEREVLEAVAKHGTKWTVIMRALGARKSPDAWRKKYERIFGKQ